MQPSDRNIHKIFSMKTLMHTTTSSKTTHIIKTSLIKQYYTWHARTGANNAADTNMLPILLCSWYWFCWGMYALYYMLYVLCLTSIYFTSVSCWNHAVAKSCPFKTKQSLWRHSKHSFFIKLEQFQHDMFSNSKHSFIKRKQFQHDIFSMICII